MGRGSVTGGWAVGAMAALVTGSAAGCGSAAPIPAREVAAHPSPAPAVARAPAAPAGPAASGPAATGTAPTGTAPTGPAASDPADGAWHLVGMRTTAGPWSDQGLASVTHGGSARIVYRGTLTVGAGLTSRGWTHVGDPDSWGGWLVEPYQGDPGATTKMFRVTSPAGVVTEAVHPLVRGEAANNSFAAISTDGQWTVSAEWGAENRLLVFPTPVLAAPALRPLPLVGTVRLDRPVHDLQGCAFASNTQLMCSASGPNRLYRMDLGRPVGAGTTPATVTDLGSLPESGSPCAGTYEAEGIDIDRSAGVMRVEVVPPGDCAIVTQVYTYRWG